MKTNLMVYIAGDNDLDTFGETDIEEMMSVQDTGSELTILIQRDQSKNARDSGTKRYVIRNGKKEQIIHLGETNTGDASILTAFLKWGMEDFPAERNIAVLWNHGGGTRDELFPGYENNATTVRSLNTNPALGNQGSFFSESSRTQHVKKLMKEYQVDKAETSHSIGEVVAKSILFDDESKDFLDNIELKKVFDDLGKKLDIIGFDACLMNMIEVVYQLRDHTELVVGSEELEPGKGWDYKAIVSYLVDNPNATNEAVSSAIIESFIASYVSKTRLQVTLSAIRTDKLSSLACSMDNFAHAILRKEPNIRSSFLSIVDATQTFDYKSNEHIYRDLRHFVLLTQAHYSNDNEIENVCTHLLEKLSAVVLLNKTNNFDNAHGLSVYLPLLANMSDFALSIFSKLDINSEHSAPHWLKFFKQIGNLDTQANQFLGNPMLDGCVEESEIEDASEATFVEIDSSVSYTDLVAVPNNVNQNLSATGNRLMISLLGNSKSNYGRSCSSPDIGVLLNRRVVWGKDVGPFGVSGFDLAVDSLREVFTEASEVYPDLVAGLKSSGMLCCRLVRGSSSSISNHSWGTAIDIRVDGILDQQGNGLVQYGLTLLAPIFNKHGWFWGATFATEDGMHFEVSQEKLLEWQGENLLFSRPNQKPSFKRSLRLGDKGEAVLKLQQKLNRLGYELIEDGDFGNGTHYTVVDFQAAHGLVADGIVGVKTMEILERLVGQTRSFSLKTRNSTKLTMGMKSRTVQVAQEHLNSYGFMLIENGDFDKLMLQAVKDFQEAKGLELTGMVDTEMWKVLETRTKSLSSSIAKSHVMAELGDANADVYALQALLLEKGHVLSNDGYFGVEMQKVIETLQEKNGFEVTGKIDEDTRKLIKG